MSEGKVERSEQRSGSVREGAGRNRSGSGAARGSSRSGAGRGEAGKSSARPAGKAGSRAGAKTQKTGNRAAAGKKGRAATAQKSRTAQKETFNLGPTRVRDRSRLSERMKKSTRMRLFAQSIIPDFLLVLIVSTALSYTVSFGFHSAWEYRGNVLLIAALTIPVLLALFLGTWSKRTAAPSIFATIVVCAALIAGASALSVEPIMTDGVISDVPGNYTIFAVVIAVDAIISFLLSRRAVGLVFLLITAVITCGVIQFLYREWIVDEPGILATLVVIGAVGMLLIYHCYKQSVYSANRVKRTSFVGVTAFSALLAVVCVLVGVGVFYGVIQASGLQTPEIKFFEEYVSPPVDEKANSYERAQAEGDDTSSETSDEESETNQEGEGGTNETPQDIIESALRESAIAGIIAQIAGVDMGSTDEGDQAAAWVILRITALIIALLIIAAIVAIILLQRYRRTWRLKRIADRTNAYQAWFLYTFLLGRLRRLGIRKAAHLTPLEFAVGYSKAMTPFTRDTGGVDFVEVSLVYQDAVFGGIQPDDERLDRVRAYYRAFFKNARIYVGWPKWIIWKFWRI